MKARPRPERPPRPRSSPPSDADRLLGVEGATLVDILDRLLSKGVMATGDITLGVAGIDLVCLRLSALLSAVDRVLKPHGGLTPGARRRSTVDRRPADRSGRRREGRP